MIYITFLQFVYGNLNFENNFNNFFIIGIILFIFLNFMVLLLHKIYDKDINNALEDYFVDINDYDFKKRSPFEIACLRNSRLPEKKEIITTILSLINRDYIKLRKDENNVYYIKKVENISKTNLKESEIILLDCIIPEESDGLDDEYNLKKFILKMMKQYNSRKVINKMKEELLGKFDFFKKHIIFDIICFILKYFSLVCIVFIGIWMFASINILNTTSIVLAFYIFDIFVFIFELILLSYYIYIKIEKSHKLVYEKEKTGKFLGINALMLIGIVLIFLFAKGLGTLLIFCFVYSQILVLMKKRIFVNVKKGYIKEKIEAISLEKYILEHSFFKEKEIEQIMLYDEYYTYAYAFGINVKVDDKIDLKQLEIDKVIKSTSLRVHNLLEFLHESVEIVNKAIENTEVDIEL